MDPKDCDIRLILEAENQLYGKEHYAYEIKINEPISSWNTTNWNLELPKGYYHVRLHLTGKIISSDNKEKKEKILSKVLRSVQAFLIIKSASINEKEKQIPSEFGNNLRNDTFIQL